MTFTENLVSGGKRKEYALTLDMAKELSMVERNEKGKQARQYFIAVENQHKSLTSKLANDPIIAIRMLQIEMQQSIAETKTIAHQAGPFLLWSLSPIYYH